MKKLILYKSVLGSTKQYAEWLKESIGADLFKFDQINDNDLSSYDQVVVMSGTYAGSMPLTGFLVKKWDILKNKDVYAIGIGCSPEGTDISKVAYEKIPSEIREAIEYFKIIGAPPFVNAQKKAEILKRGCLDQVIKSISK